MQPATRSGCHTLSCGAAGLAGPTPTGRPSFRLFGRFAALATGSYTRRRSPTLRLDGRRVRRRADSLHSCGNALHRKRYGPPCPRCWRLTSLALLSQVSSPTLVLHRREVPNPGVAAARGLAAGIPDARLVLLEGASLAPWVGDMEAVLQATDEFLGEGPGARQQGPSRQKGWPSSSSLTSPSSTALTEQLGDTAFRAKARELDTSLRSVIRDSAGTPVEGKVLGDGVLAVFTSARRAIDAPSAAARKRSPWGCNFTSASTPVMSSERGTTSTVARSTSQPASLLPQSRARWWSRIRCARCPHSAGVGVRGRRRARAEGRRRPAASVAVGRRLGGAAHPVRADEGRVSQS